jgi:uroporphyrinogen decarboxylase
VDEPVEREWRREKAGVITSMEEFEEHEWPAKGEFGDGGVDAHAATLPDGMKLIPITVLHEHVATLLGTETLLMGIYDEPELVAATYARVGEWTIPIYEKLAGHPAVGALWIGDDLAYTEGMFFSPDFAREHILPWYAQIAEIARAHDLPFIFHSDGDIRPVIPDLIELGVNAIHPIEPKGMDIAELKRDYGDRLCLIGNLDLCYTLPRGTPEEVAAEVKLRISQAGPGGGYCVSSANSVTEYVPLRNFEAMVEATFKYGEYPLVLRQP